MRRFLLLIAAAALLLAPASAAAQDVPRLTGPITDQTGVLSGSQPAITSAINGLLRDHNVQLFVLFVRTTGSTSVTDYATEVASTNSLGVNDALLVVALDDRTDAIWLSDGLPQITNDEVDQIISTGVEPRLAAGDFGGAVVAAANGLGQAAGAVVPVPTVAPTAPPTGAPTPAATATTAPGSQPGSSGGGIGILPIIALVAVIVGVVLVVRSRSRGRPGGVGPGQPSPAPGSPVAPVSPAELARRANAALIEMDESIRDANQELGFVEAQYGAAEAANFRPDLDRAAAEVQAAFVLRQQLDDSVPEDAATSQRMLAEILERCERARAIVTKQDASVSTLRDIERTAPDLLSHLPPQVEAVEARLAPARAAVEGLSDYAPAIWQSVAGNVAEAEKRIDVARSSIEDGTEAVGKGERGLAASYVRQAQSALAEAVALFDAIDRLAASLRDAHDRLPAELAAAASDVEAARSAVAAGPTTAELTAGLAEAQRLLAAAQAAAGATKPDVLDAYQKATQANAAADKIVAGARAEGDRVARRRAVLDGAVQSARMSVGRASDFITTRRGGVGSEARTRLVEAQRQLDLAGSQAATDPDAALASAQRAQGLADEAYRIAAQDFTQFDRPQPTGVEGTGTLNQPGDVGANVAGAIIGGILGGMLNGGGWGGTRWGSPSPPGGFGRGGGGFGRTISGGWGGLGGRSRGGHW